MELKSKQYVWCGDLSILYTDMLRFNIRTGTTHRGLLGTVKYMYSSYCTTKYTIYFQELYKILQKNARDITKHTGLVFDIQMTILVSLRYTDLKITRCAI